MKESYREWRTDDMRMHYCISHPISEWYSCHRTFWTCVLVTSVVSDSLQSPELYPARLLCPWNTLGKNTRVVAVPSSRGSSRPREQTLTYYVSCIYKRFLYHYHPLRSHRTFWRVLWNLRTAHSKGWEEEAFTIDSSLVKGGPHFWIMHLWLENKFPWLSHIATSEKLWSRKQKVNGRVLTVPGKTS